MCLWWARSVRGVVYDGRSLWAGIVGGVCCGRGVGGVCGRGEAARQFRARHTRTGAAAVGDRHRDRARHRHRASAAMQPPPRKVSAGLGQAGPRRATGRVTGAARPPSLPCPAAVTETRPRRGLSGLGRRGRVWVALRSGGRRAAGPGQGGQRIPAPAGARG